MMLSWANSTNPSQTSALHCIITEASNTDLNMVTRPAGIIFLELKKRYPITPARRPLTTAHRKKEY